MTLKDELTRSVGAQYATGEEWIKMPERDRAKPKTMPSCGCDWLMEVKSNSLKNNIT